MCGRVVRAGLIFAWGDGNDATGDRPARKTAIGYSYRVAASSEPLSPRKSPCYIYVLGSSIHLGS